MKAEFVSSLRHRPSLRPLFLIATALMAVAGCGLQPDNGTSDSTISPQYATNTDHRSRSVSVQEFLKRESELAALTNLYPRPDGDKARPNQTPAVVRRDGLIELSDLGLLMRPVKFDKPIDDVPILYFSETEVTNQMYAAFLADTGQFRDDSALEVAARQVPRSTASPSITVSDRLALWRRGIIPEGRADHPVSFITIGQAMEFCEWLNSRYDLEGSFRLPTEEEWLFAAYGANRDFPWGNEARDWTGKTTDAVKTRPELRTPDGLYGMWGNVSEFVLSPWNGYGGRIKDKYSPFITAWLGTCFQEENIRGLTTQPRQDYWGYTHSLKSRRDTWGFRVVFVPRKNNGQ